MNGMRQSQRAKKDLSLILYDIPVHDSSNCGTQGPRASWGHLVQSDELVPHDAIPANRSDTMSPTSVPKGFLGIIGQSPGCFQAQPVIFQFSS